MMKKRKLRYRNIYIFLLSCLLPPFKHLLYLAPEGRKQNKCSDYLLFFFLNIKVHLLLRVEYWNYEFWQLNLTIFLNSLSLYQL